MSQARWQEPNLARAPFVNERPVRRLAVTLWTLFAIVGGLGVWQSQASREQASSRLAELVRLNRETASARERAVALDRELRSADLPAQNERTEFLNRRLAERSFSWSRLLESLTQVMPRGVRLVRLSPEGFASERRRSGARSSTAATTRVAIRLTGEAEDTEALLEFVDRLFQDPAFDRPNLSRESEKKDAKIQFELTVAYLPEVARESPAGIAGASPATGTLPSPADRRPGATAAAPPPAGDAQATSAVAAGAPAPSPAPSVRPTAGAAGLAGRQPSPRPAVGGSVWGDRGAAGADSKVEADARSQGAAVPAGGGRFPGASGGVPTMGAAGATAAGGQRPGAATAPGSVPRPGSGSQFPNNVMPTALRPYASSTGGGQ